MAALFLRLGLTSFGGPAVHVAMMEDEVVRRRGWLAREEFLDLVGAVNLIPGPNSTELAIHVGFRRAGWAGLLVAGVCFILPAAVLVGLLAWAYVRWGTLPAVGPILAGVKPVLIAIVLQALWGLGRSAVKTPALGGLAVAAVAAGVAGVPELGVLAGAGLMALGGRAVAGRPGGPGAGGLPLLAAVVPPAGAAGAATTVVTAAAAAGAPVGLGSLFLFFLKVGSVLYGSGYVLLAFLRADLVEGRGWLTEGQLLDAIAVGQFTPGPVFTTATFIGYVLAGWPGAGVATVGIFLPAFCLVALSGRLVPWLRRSPWAGAFLDGVNVASLALMAVVTWALGRVALVDGLTWGLAAASALLLWRWRVNSAWLVLGGGVVGWLAG
ncbi:MAG: hypothetical protein RJA22_302 [Verrucomicrobiota bacterium]